MERRWMFVLAAFLATAISSSALAAEHDDTGMMGDSNAAEEMAPKAPAYKIDASHSTIGFAVKHLQVATTRGKFADYTGIIHFDPDNLEAFHAEITIQVASIDTDNADRDKHLVTGDFFDAENHPTITFKSTRLDKRGGNYVMVGDLTIRGVTKELTFPVDIAGPLQSPFGQTVVALSAQMTINRQDFGVSWNKTMDNGGLVVDDIVTLIAEFELHQDK